MYTHIIYIYIYTHLYLYQNDPDNPDAAVHTWVHNYLYVCRLYVCMCIYRQGIPLMLQGHLPSPDFAHILQN